MTPPEMRKARMDEPKDNQLSSNEKLSGPKGDNLAMEVPASDKGGETEQMPLHEEVGRLKELIVELKGNLIAVNRGIVARQDTIDQLTKRKQKLLVADQDQNASQALALPTPIMSDAIVELDLNDLMDNHLERDAIEIFPEEIWELILGNLNEPQDLRSASTSCQLFDKILHPLKSNFLFIGVFPHICSYLDDRQIVDCRGVCKGWNEGVDNFLENHPALIPCEKAAWNPRNPPPTNGLFYLEFSNVREPGGLNFLEKMRGHARNPFVGRAVSIRVSELVDIADSSDVEVIDISSDREDDLEPNHPVRPPIQDLENQVREHRRYIVFADSSSSDSEDDGDPNPFALGIQVGQPNQLFWQALLDFLSRFGEHIWYLNFQWDRNGSFPSEASLFRFLTKEIYILTPNLRRIEIIGYLPSPMLLMSMVRPLPNVPKLEALKFVKEPWGHFGANDMLMGSVIKNLIHASCQQLKQLHVHWAAWKHIFKSNLEWTNLTELYISDDGVGGILKVEDLVPSRMPHLRKIGLPLSGLNSDSQDTLKIINKLSATTNLYVLRLFGEIKREQIHQVPSRLFAHPNLKTLEMDHPSWRVDYDYTLLLCFPFRENLVVFHYQIEYNSGRNKERFERQIVEMEPYMGQGRVYECEIWELLPRLKNFMVQRYVRIREGKCILRTSTFTRECYEWIMSSKKDLETEVELIK